MPLSRHGTLLETPTFHADPPPKPEYNLLLALCVHSGLKSMADNTVAAGHHWNAQPPIW